MSRKYKKERRDHGQALFAELRRRGLLQREPSDAEMELFGDTALHADVQATQQLDWIRSAVELAERVSVGTATPAETSLFWIRSAGILLDIAPKIRRTLDLGRELFGDISRSPVHVMSQKLADAIAAIPSALENDELFYLEHRRHVECHPWQSAYRARLRKDGTLATVPSKLQERRDQDDSEDLLRAVARRHGGNEVAIGRAIATAILEPLRSVHAAAEPLCTAREWRADW